MRILLLYDQFVSTLLSIDDRNVIEKVTNKISDSNIPQIYKEYDFIDVVVPCRFGELRFYPISKFDDLKKEYSYVENGCIFATNNGEPVFVKNNSVFTCIKGKEKLFIEELACSFEELLEMILDE